MLRGSKGNLGATVSSACILAWVLGCVLAVQKFWDLYKEMLLMMDRN